MARDEQTREKFLEILATTPFINHACKKVGISRATIYRWMKDNYRFRQKVLKATDNGRENLIEVAEVSLINKVRTGDLGAVKFFLTHNSKRYSARPDSSNMKPERSDSTSAFIGADGRLLISEKTKALIRKEEKEEWEAGKEERNRKNRIMGFPNSIL